MYRVGGNEPFLRANPRPRIPRNNNDVSAELSSADKYVRGERMGAIGVVR